MSEGITYCYSQLERLRIPYLNPRKKPPGHRAGPWSALTDGLPKDMYVFATILATILPIAKILAKIIFLILLFRHDRQERVGCVKGCKGIMDLLGHFWLLYISFGERMKSDFVL